MSSDRQASAEFGIYVHYPNCRNACGYCDFPKVRQPDFPHRAYTEAVLREMDLRAGSYRGSRLRSLYFGGGTPSLWPAEQIGRVVRAATRGFDRAAEGVEVTVEANPETLCSELIDDLLAAGVDRLSIGVQSLDDAALATLGRNHDARAAIAAVAAAARAGIDNINCDLIFGFGGQSVDHHLEQLRRLIDLRPVHISTYALTLAGDAPLARAGHRPVDEDVAAEMMERGREVLEAAGLLQYEVSNYAREGRQSVHNSLVWRCRPYLGLGAWAHSMVPQDRQRGAWYRLANPAWPAYLQSVSSAVAAGRRAAAGGLLGAEVEQCAGERARHEVLMLGLRTTAGVDRAEYAWRFGRDPVVDHREILCHFIEAGVLQAQPARLVPTRRGIWFADEVALRLMTWK